MRKITLDDQQLLFDFVNSCDYEHYFTFTYFLLWDERYDFWFHFDENFILVWSKNYNYFFSPISKKEFFNEAKVWMNDWLKEKELPFIVHNALVDFKNSFDDENYVIESNRDTADYIYNA